MPPSSSKDKDSFLNFLVQFLAIAIVFFAIGFSFGQKKINFEKNNLAPKINVENQAGPQNANIDFSLFWQVFETLPRKYLDKSAIDPDKLLYGAISGMVRSLGDPYTAFLDPKQNEAIREDLAGSYEGVGIQIGFSKDKRLSVIAPLRGTPAEQIGIRAKDFILKIDTKDTFDITLPEAVDLIRGKAGTNVKLTLVREGIEKPFEKEIKRAKIDVRSVEVEYKDNSKGQIAVIKVSRFGEKTDSEWDAAVNDVLNRKVKGIIVDMRNNPGGLLSSSIHLAAEFVTGTIVKQEFAGGEQESLPADRKGQFLTLPLVVLVNGGSASASEIFAGAIQDKNRGKITGEKTFGKGTVQDVVELPKGAGLHVTIAKWLTPNGTSIHDEGITPDIIIEDKDTEDEKDEVLDKALEML